LNFPNLLNCYLKFESKTLSTPSYNTEMFERDLWNHLLVQDKIITPIWRFANIMQVVTLMFSFGLVLFKVVKPPVSYYEKKIGWGKLRHGKWGQVDIFPKGRRFLGHLSMDFAEILYTYSPNDSTWEFLESSPNSKKWAGNFNTEQKLWFCTYFLIKNIWKNNRF